MNATINNIIQIVGVIILSLVGLIGKNMMEDITALGVQLKAAEEKLGNRISSLEVGMAELKVELKHVTTENGSIARKNAP